MSATRYTYLGPEGTFTEAALRTLPEAATRELVPLASVPAALDAVRAGEAAGAFVPVENSVEGAVTATSDELASGAPLMVYREVLLPIIGKAVAALRDVTLTQTTKQRLALTVAEPGRVFTEEERSRVPSVFTVLRAITALFRSDQDANLGLYGAFGYDLAFQFDPIEHSVQRAESRRDAALAEAEQRRSGARGGSQETDAPPAGDADQNKQ